MEKSETIKLEITLETMIPELLEAYPQLRSIFDRYGLHGCGGDRGPAESLKFFSRAHGVDEGILLRELQEALEISSSSHSPSSQNENKGNVSPEEPLMEDIIYRRFFKAGIITTLSAGALWGALLLLNIAMRGSFTSISIHDINAHGHAQIMGWVGLFVMGFAYQAFPRFKQARLFRPELANFSFYLMVIGIILRVIGEPLSSSRFFLWMGVAGSSSELLAVILFGIVMIGTLLNAEKKRESYDFYIIASLFWLLIQAGWDMMLYWLTATAPTRELLLSSVATFQAPLRDIQIHGFALTMILGVSQRYLSGIYNFKKSSDSLSLLSLALITIAVLGESGFFLLMRVTKNHFYGIGLYLSFLVLVGAVLILTRSWHLFDKMEEQDRSLKFIRIAYIWLYVSLAMLLVMPFYNNLIGQPFSHAYFGATRHAITVGFISMMILGVAAKVVPTLNGIDVRALGGLWVPFILVNLGCTLRVSSQILTDFSPIAFKLIGFSGFMEVTGIAMWAFHIWRTMSVTRSSEKVTEPKPNQILPDHRVGWVVRVAPELLPIFLKSGFKLLGNPFLRSTLAEGITIHQACNLKNLAEESFLQELNGALQTR